MKVFRSKPGQLQGLIHQIERISVDPGSVRKCGKEKRGEVGKK